MEGGEETPVLTQRPDYMNWAVWRDNIVYINPGKDEGPTIELLDLKTNEVTQVAALGPDMRYEVGMTVSPDGEWILFTREEQIESDLMLVEDFR